MTAAFDDYNFHFLYEMPTQKIRFNIPKPSIAVCQKNILLQSGFYFKLEGISYFIIKQE
jgi:hypothetical protein